MDATEESELRQSSEMRACDVCSADARRRFSVGSHEILECPQCGHRFVGGVKQKDHVQHIYSDDYFFGGGDGYPDYLDEAEILVSHGERYAEIVARYMRPGRLLDVGCAAGFVLKGFVRNGWEGHGLEPNPTMAEFARERLSLCVTTSAIEEFVSESKYDLTSLIQVVGHFCDLNRALTQIRSATAVGGHCLIEYWNCRSAIARLMGKHWQEYSPPSVQHWFGDRDLDLLLNNYGFTLRARGRPRKFLAGRHVRSFIAHKVKSTPIQKVVAAALKLIPEKAEIRYPPFDLKWALYRRAE